MPLHAIHADALGHGPVYFGVGEGLGFAVVPSPAGESSEVWRECLLKIYPEAVLPRDVPRMVCDVGRGHKTFLKLDDGVAVDAHVGIVGEGREADYAGFFRNEAV